MLLEVLCEVVDVDTQAAIEGIVVAVAALFHN